MEDGTFAALKKRLAPAVPTHVVCSKITFSRCFYSIVSGRFFKLGTGLHLHAGQEKRNCL